ncbi:UNVERIFIED_CONTAM: hypothetical protein Slati_3698600 [Sesamum latifolium]|uniref:Uncharacterized protein n=1 Tax=Sesamum latifolium TaxID=2727402 RepID=A0AAW2U2M5_9LAMI
MGVQPSLIISNNGRTMISPFCVEGGTNERVLWDELLKATTILSTKSNGVRVVQRATLPINIPDGGGATETASNAGGVHSSSGVRCRHVRCIGGRTHLSRSVRQYCRDDPRRRRRIPH